MRTFFYFNLFFLIFFTNARKKVWTESEESKYLENIKEQELRQFENEMRQQSEKRGRKFSLTPFGIPKSDLPVELDMTVLPRELRPIKQILKNEKAPQYAALQSHASENDGIHSLLFKTDDTGGENEHWCYHCATPVDKLKSEMRKSIKSLLEMRRAVFPIDAVTPDCLSARNKTLLKKQKCSFKYCQSLSILDRNAGNAFVVRGCAETFGAINVVEMEKKPDHSCEMLHEKLEIKECICKSAKYCNAGWRKRSAGFSNSSRYFLYPIIFVVYFWV